MGQGEWLPGKRASCKAQAPSSKAQASSLKLQASSYKLKSFLNFNPISRGPWSMAKSHKLLDLVPWNKFQGPLTKGPDKDKCILWM